jgi:hypothetical protein
MQKSDEDDRKESKLTDCIDKPLDKSSDLPSFDFNNFLV